MALGYNVTIRNSRLALIQAAIDAGAGAGLLRIYDGVRPATGGAATTLLAELTMGDPSAGAPSAGVLTFNAITQDSAADATGTATWFRIVDSNTNHVVDGSVGATSSGEDMELTTTSIAAGVAVSISSFVLTAGNA